MRLMNIARHGKDEWRVVLDSERESTNYVEKTQGVYFDKDTMTHKCLKCTSQALWLNWHGKNQCKDVCQECGQVQRIKIIPMHKKADGVQ